MHAMGIHIKTLSLSLITIFINLLSTSANGGSSLYKKQNLHFSSAKLKFKAVSHAADSYTTNYADVLGLELLVTTFYPLLEAETADPCVAPIWSWIQCNSDPTPRVIALDLGNRALVGQLPDFSSMDALQIIDLSANALLGLIPSFLGTFPHLQQLNLANNLFYGMVPDSLACNKNLKLMLTGNAGLTISDKCSNNSPSTPGNSISGDGDGDIYGNPSRSKKKSNLPAILGGTISALVVVWVGVGAFAIHRHKAKTAATVAQGCSDPTPNTPMEEMPINDRPTHLSP